MSTPGATSATSLARALGARREAILDAAIVALRVAIAGYERMDTQDLRGSLSALFDALIELSGDSGPGHFAERMSEISRRRLAQGITSGDLMRAALILRPVVLDHVRAEEVGPEGVRRIDAVLQQLIVDATNTFTDEVQRRLEARNQALRRANQELEAHRAALSREVADQSRALLAARNLNAKVLESLPSGIVVVEAVTLRVILYSERAEQILGLPSEAVLGRSVVSATAALGGLDTGQLVTLVQHHGELPLTKRRLTLADGRSRWVYLSARRLLDEQGDPEGTVVVVDDVSERELLLDSFSRYVSRDVVQRLLARGSLELAGERRVLTVLFADIRGFTGLAERLPPERLHDLLNRYFRVMIEAVTDHGGFVDKFVGDKVMAIFGHAPSADDGAGAAVRAAVALQAASCALAGDEPVLVGVGVNTGLVLLGNVGSEQRMDFTAIGDAVNVADRLQGLARRAEILVGSETAARLQGVPLRALGPVTLRGRAAAVEVFEVLLPAE